MWSTLAYPFFSGIAVCFLVFIVCAMCVHISYRRHCIKWLRWKNQNLWVEQFFSLMPHKFPSNRYFMNFLFHQWSLSAEIKFDCHSNEALSDQKEEKKYIETLIDLFDVFIGNHYKLAFTTRTHKRVQT